MPKLKRIALLLLLVFMAPLLARAADCSEWYTGNEAAVPGDWDGTIETCNSGTCPSVARSNAYVHSGSYSYRHHSGIMTSGGGSGVTYIDCADLTSGVFEGWLLAEDTNWPPGGAATDDKGLFALMGTSGGGQVYAWTIGYSDWENRAIFECKSCADDGYNTEAVPRHGLGKIFYLGWHHFRVEWDLPEFPATGSYKVWMDGDLYVDADNVPMRTGTFYANTPHQFRAGIEGWHYTQSKDRAVYIDDVYINPPEATPTPTPGPPDACDQYGHAAVINVDSDCSGVLRFDNIKSIVPGGAHVTSAELQIYGIAAEEVGEEIHVVILNRLWGEMTCDWCRRTVGSMWAVPGAEGIPQDREPGRIATFETDIGWISIPLPTALVEEWARSAGANPGLLFRNPWMTGRFSFASSEYYHPTTDYTPQLIVHWTD